MYIKGNSATIYFWLEYFLIEILLSITVFFSIFLPFRMGLGTVSNLLTVFVLPIFIIIVSLSYYVKKSLKNGTNLFYLESLESYL